MSIFSPPVQELDPAPTKVHCIPPIDHTGDELNPSAFFYSLLPLTRHPCAVFLPFIMLLFTQNLNFLAGKLHLMQRILPSMQTYTVKGFFPPLCAQLHQK